MKTIDNQEDTTQKQRAFKSKVFIICLALFLACFLLSFGVYRLLLIVDRKELVRKTEIELIHFYKDNSICCYYYSDDGINSTVVFPYVFPLEDYMNAALNPEKPFPSLFKNRPYGEYYNYVIEKEISDWGRREKKTISAVTPYNQQSFTLKKLTGYNGDYYLRTYKSLGAIYYSDIDTDSACNIYRIVLNELIGEDAKRPSLFKWLSPSHFLSTKYYYISVNDHFDNNLYMYRGPKALHRFDSDDEWIVFIEEATSRALVVDNIHEQKRLFHICLTIWAIAAIIISFCYCRWSLKRLINNGKQ